MFGREDLLQVLSIFTTPMAMLERIGMMADDPEASKIVGFDQIYDDFLDDD